MKKQEAAGKVTTIVTSDTGNVDRASPRRRRSSRGTFNHHYQSHVPIGPGCAVADVTPTRRIVYSNTQNPHTSSPTSPRCSG